MNKIALVGNPNSGKSSLFNKLTGLKQKVANFPGVTVDKKTGYFSMPDGREIELVDLPGAYSLYPTSQDERVVLNILTNPSDDNYPDAIVYVADVTNLEKHLLLLTQVRDLGFPCLLALNMADVAAKDGLHINEEKLSKYLGMPVVSVSGRTGTNVEELKKMALLLLDRNVPPPREDAFHLHAEVEQRVIQRVQSEFGVENAYRALLMAHHAGKLPFLSEEEKEGIRRICAEEGFQDLRQQIAETMQRFEHFVPVIKSAVAERGEEMTLTDRLDSILTHKYLAPLIFFVIMFFVFQAIYAWAELPMDLIETGFATLADGVKAVLPGGWVTSLLTDGVIAGLGGIMVFIPQIAILFFLITILEEIGYMARAVFIFDRLMQQFGLNGRSVVALVSGGACAIPAIMSTRTIGNWKERLITIMVTPLISCSARIPVYAVLIGFVVPSETVWGVLNLQGLAFMGLYLLGIAAAFLSALVFKKILKSEERSWLMLQLPPYRLPVWRNVWHTIREKVSAFIVEAGKVIMVISVILWVLASFGPPGEMAEARQEALQKAERNNLSEAQTEDLIASLQIENSYAGHLGKSIEPLIAPLGFDWKIGIAIVTSFAAREVFVGTMATIYSIGSAGDEETVRDKLAAARNPVTGAKVYTAATSLSLLIFYVFAMQCMSTLAVVRRETGSWKWAIIQFSYMGAMAYFGSLITYQLMT